MAFILSDYFITYKIISTPYASIGFNYNIAIWVKNDKRVEYNLSEVVKRDCNVSYNLEANKAFQDFLITYGVIVSNDLTINYDIEFITGMVVSDIQLEFDIRYMPYSEIDLNYSIVGYNPVSRGFSISYHLYDGTEETLNVMYLRD